MKNKVIQICGTNGTGKTTLVKGILNSGKFRRMELSVNGVSKEWWYDGKVAVIGKYNQANCCGVDAGKYTGEQLLKVLKQIIEVYAPETVLFEDIRFGGSYTFKTKILKIAKNFKYDCIILTLFASLGTVSKRVIERSGNEKVNLDGILSKSRQVIRSSQKVKKDGAEVVFVDTDMEDKASMLSVLRGIIHG